VIFQHNIFVRDRRYAPPVDRVAPAPRPPEELMALIGVVKEDDGVYQAYIEDNRQRPPALHKLTLNQAIANGKITDVSMASIVYSVDGKPPVTVAVGANLTGAIGSRLSILASSASRTDYGGYSGGQNNLPTNTRGGRNGQAGNFATGAAGLLTQAQTFAGGAQGAGGRGRGGAGGQPFIVQNAAPVIAPQPLPGTDNMTLEERMRLRRQSEGQPAAVVQMTGTQPTVAAPAPAEAAPAPAPIVDPSIGANLSVEDQMRLRRAQQGGQ